MSAVVVIRIAKMPDELPQVLAVRHDVFQIEQQVDRDLEIDGEDERATHLIAIADAPTADLPIGTLRLRPLDELTVKLERLAVLKAYRSQGIGKKLVEYAIATVAEIGQHAVVKLHAQEQVRDFYRKLGFQQVGDRFLEAEMPHVAMYRNLDRHLHP